MSKHAVYQLKTGHADKERLTITNDLFNPGAIAFMREMGLKEGARVLELGCGIGHTSALIAKIIGTNGKVYAVDISEAQLEIAKAHCKLSGINNVEFIQHDAYDLEDLDIEVDFIYTRWVLEHLSSPKQILKNLFDKLSVGGIFTCHTASMIDGAHFCCPPNSVVAELIHLLGSAIISQDGVDSETNYKITTWLKEINASHIHVEIDQPVLKTAREKSIYRLLLEGMSEQLSSSGVAEEK